LLAGRGASGDLDSFGQLYDRYFNRVYDFCWRVTRDTDDAAEATQETFARAMRGLAAAAKPPGFQASLFAIAHEEAVARAERAGRRPPLPAPTHEEAFGSFDVPDPSRIDDPQLAADPELPGQVWEAASVLGARDYALLDLHLRQGLGGAELAQVLNVSKGAATSTVNRMKAAAGDVIGGYVLAKRGSRDCEGLRGVLAGFEFPPYTEELRRALDQHVRGCDVCGRVRRGLAPLAIFAAFAAVTAPFALKGDIWRGVAAAWPYGGEGALAAASPGAAIPAPAAAGAAAPMPRDAEFDEDDRAFAAAAAGGGGGAGALARAFPTGGGEGGNRIVLFAVAVLGLVVFAFAIAGGIILAGGGGDDDGGGGGADATRTAASGSPTSTPGVVVETPTEGPATATSTQAPETATATEAPPTETPLPAATDTPEPPTATNTPRGSNFGPTRVPTEPPGDGGDETPEPEATGTP
jgi:DNA-directed RNA polymerase specialized sigma24 family protein